VTRPFVNRIEEIKYLKQQLKYDGKEGQVLVFTGIGGMGKTALRIAFEERVLKPKKIPYAVLDYDDDPDLRPIEATLTTIRRQLGRHGVKTPVFDYLYARYFELSTGLKLSSKNFPPELEGVVSVLEGIPRVGNVTQILPGLIQLGLVAKERLQHKEWLYRVRELEPREVLNLLPEVLAEDLEEVVTSQSLKVLKSLGYRIPLILNAYERLAESQLEDTLHRRLLFLTPHLLRVIFTRDPLPWEDKFPQEWRGNITHFPSLDDFSQKDLTEEFVRHLLRQLKDDEKNLMRLAVFPRWVSREILEMLSLVPEGVPRIFKKFIGLSIFSPHPEIPEAYIIRKEVRDCLLLEQRQRRWWKKQHGTLSAFHKERWEETQSFNHLREAIYHGFYESPEEAMQMFEEHFWKLLRKLKFGEAEGLLQAVPQEMLSETAKRKFDYAHKQLFTARSSSQGVC